MPFGLSSLGRSIQSLGLSSLGRPVVHGHSARPLGFRQVHSARPSGLGQTSSIQSQLIRIRPKSLGLSSFGQPVGLGQDVSDSRSDSARMIRTHHSYSVEGHSATPLVLGHGYSAKVTSCSFGLVCCQRESAKGHSAISVGLGQDDSDSAVHSAMPLGRSSLGHLSRTRPG